MSEKTFHKNRIAFAFINDKVYFLQNDSRGHLKWLKQDFNITDAEFETIPRGYIKDDKIICYIGSNFDCIEKNIILNEFIPLLKRDILEHGIYQVWNGCIIGEIGIPWKNKEFIGIFDL